MKPLDVFEVFPCTLLRPVELDEGVLQEGLDVFGTITPSGRVYLSQTGNAGDRNLGPVFSSDAQAGVDFQASQDILDRLALGSGYEQDANRPGLWVKKPGV